MAKIAVELKQALAYRSKSGEPGGTTACRLARTDNWSVADVICTAGPQDGAFEERHTTANIAIVVAGTFQYKSQAVSGCELMTPGSLFLGNTGQCFECGHEHGSGDRCISFGYAPGYFEQIASDAGIRGLQTDFRVLRLPPLREISTIVAQACAALDDKVTFSWEEISIKLAAKAVRLADGLTPRRNGCPAGALARVTQVMRRIEQDSEDRLSLLDLAKEARLSPYHFLRTFEHLTGVTPHQYIRRRRLRESARRLLTESVKILDIALDCGFGDVSNFNRAFRTEFGINPRNYRRQMGRLSENPSL